jgi:putative colanic acid biosynthesis UDP-glucose lipid carrier transferase
MQRKETASSLYICAFILSGSKESMVMNQRSGMIQNNTNKFAVLYRLSDYVNIQITLYIAASVYGATPYSDHLVISFLATLGFAFTAESFSLYRSWRAGDFKQLVFYTTLSWATAVLLVLFFLFFSKLSVQFSRVTLALWFSLAIFGLLGSRLCFALFLFHIRRRGFNSRNVVIIGLTEGAVRLAEEIQGRPESGFRLSAIFDDRAPSRLDPKYHYLLKGTVDEGVTQARQNQFDIVYIAIPMTAEARVKKILFQLGDTTANVHLIPDFFTYCLMNASMSQVGQVQTISIYNNPMKGSGGALKRVEDIGLSLAILTIIALPMLVIALGITLTSKGPVLFKQDRYGLDGKKIKILKFRSMSVAENGTTVTQATKNDVRITPLGAFLRRTSLDELPQFLNVLGGSMSVVGPRPHAVSHNEEYRKQVDYYMLRHKVKPGITGWAQVNGWRGETDTIEKMQKRIDFDLEYIRHWSLWMDFKIVLLTITKGFMNKNAY